MDNNLQILLYVIIGIVYLISKLSKRSGEPDGSANQETTNRPVRRESTTNRPTAAPPLGPTFEDLLREITESKRASSIPQQVDVQEDYKTIYIPKEVVNQPVTASYTYDDDHISKVYEDAKKQAFNRPSLEESMLQQSRTIEHGTSIRKHKHDEEEPSLLERYLEELRDPEGMRKAVVMSEILQRKF